MRHPRRDGRLSAALTLLLALAVPFAAHAQATADPAAPQKCRAPAGQQPGQAGSVDPLPAPQGGQSDTNRLADCGGVLQPPATGDPGLVAPAPDVGRTPVLPPPAAQQPRSGG